MEQRQRTNPRDGKLKSEEMGCTCTSNPTLDYAVLQYDNNNKVFIKIIVRHIKTNLSLPCHCATSANK